MKIALLETFNVLVLLSGMSRRNPGQTQTVRNTARSGIQIKYILLTRPEPRRSMQMTGRVHLDQRGRCRHALVEWKEGRRWSNEGASSMNRVVWVV